MSNHLTNLNPVRLPIEGHDLLGFSLMAAGKDDPLCRALIDYARLLYRLSYLALLSRAVEQ